MLEPMKSCVIRLRFVYGWPSGQGREVVDYDCPERLQRDVRVDSGVAVGLTGAAAVEDEQIKRTVSQNFGPVTLQDRDMRITGEQPSLSKIENPTAQPGY